MDFFSPDDERVSPRFDATRVRLTPVDERLPVACRTGGLSLSTVQGMRVSRVFENTLLVPLFNFCHVDGPVFGDASFFVHCGIATLGICNFGNAKLGIFGFGNDGVGSFGSENFGNENPDFSSPSGSSEILAETLRLPGAGCSDGLTGSEVSAAIVVKPKQLTSPTIAIMAK